MGLLTYIASLLSLNGLAPPAGERTHLNAVGEEGVIIEKVPEMPMPVAPHAGKEQETPVVIERDCQERYFTQRIDHFNFNSFAKGEKDTYQQRYFVCKPEYWKEGGPIFFYTGNEASVELYITHTGLMWENAPAFGALMIFAEHRFFGKSMPFGEDSVKHMQYCTPDQAMADYTDLIYHIKTENGAETSTVITFGGSYGGMLSYWMRLKYPSVVDGALAASAPVLGGIGEVVPPDTGAFARIITLDATSFGFAADTCAPNMRRAWDVIDSFAQNEHGRAELSRIFRRCEDSHIKNPSDAKGISSWIAGAIDYMAMGSYPYPSSYLLNGKGMLPAYPVAAACKHFEDPELSDTALLEGIMDGINVYYNNSGDKPCYGKHEKTAFDTPYWEYMTCTELYSPLTRNGVDDMYWPQTANDTEFIETCHEEYGVRPNLQAQIIKYGGRKGMAAVTNVIFTNGDMDPWAGNGVLENVHDSVIAIVIPKAGHHEDLMFSHPLDPPSLKDAREQIIAHMWKWVAGTAATSTDDFQKKNVAETKWVWKKN